MDPGDVVHVPRRLREALTPGGAMLDLQVIRPDPRIEVDGRCVFEIDGEPLFAVADAATRAVDALVGEELLVEEAVDDHDVLKHYATGGDLIEDWTGKDRELPAASFPFLETHERPCAVRERCRLRRLRVAQGPVVSV
jgi:hypothetical protein